MPFLALDRCIDVPFGASESSLILSCRFIASAYSSNPCRNNATCIHQEEGNSEHSLECLCLPGFLGRLCEKAAVDETTTVVASTTR